MRPPPKAREMEVTDEEAAIPPEVWDAYIDPTKVIPPLDPWECAYCGTANHYTRAQCRRCDCDREPPSMADPTAVLLAPFWVCWRCESANLPRRSHCACCDLHHRKGTDQ